MKDNETVRRVLAKLEELKAVRRNKDEELQRLYEAEQHLQDCIDARAIFQGIAEDIQNKVHQTIAAIVERCLSVVFDTPYRFRIRFEQRRGRTEAFAEFLDDQGNPYGPDEMAGGVVDVAAFALRLAAMTLSRPNVRKIMLLDEPFRCLFRNLGERIKQLLETLSKEMAIQFVMVTHDDFMQAGKVIQL